MYNQPKLRRDVTNIISDSLKDGLIPWRKSWSNDPNLSGVDTNCVTRKQYKGINALILGLESLKCNYKSKWWGTAKQWERLKAKVKPNSEGVYILLCSAPMRRVIHGRRKMYFIFKQIVIYNLNQVEGKSVDYLRETPSNKIIHLTPDYESANKIIKSIGADIRYGYDRARYVLPEPYADFPKHTSGDYIEMPREIQFKDPNSFYETLFHELAHWTERRVGWIRDENNLSRNYSMGELIAELSASFIASELNLPLSKDLTNHNGYVEHWLKSMSQDYNFIFKACSQAKKVVRYLLKSKPVERFDY